VHHCTFWDLCDRFAVTPFQQKAEGLHQAGFENLIHAQAARETRHPGRSALDNFFDEAYFKQWCQRRRDGR